MLLIVVDRLLTTDPAVGWEGRVEPCTDRADRLLTCTPSHLHITTRREPLVQRDTVRIHTYRLSLGTKSASEHRRGEPTSSTTVQLLPISWHPSSPPIPRTNTTATARPTRAPVKIGDTRTLQSEDREDQAPEEVTFQHSRGPSRLLPTSNPYPRLLHSSPLSPLDRNHPR